EPDEQCDLDYTPNTARVRRVDVALSVGSGFGGFQSAMVVRAVPEMAAAARIPSKNRMEPSA
ncbi:MAG: minimal ketosynthase alpha, partial [Frankiaceae bacterium]|nr:minimal ketosynthase alpha [Frankiaceae bacterium]